MTELLDSTLSFQKDNPGLYVSGNLNRDTAEDIGLSIFGNKAISFQLRTQYKLARGSRLSTLLVAITRMFLDGLAGTYSVLQNNGSFYKRASVVSNIRI
jgi:hypothetical protein